MLSHECAQADRRKKACFFNLFKSKIIHTCKSSRSLWCSFPGVSSVSISLKTLILPCTISSSFFNFSICWGWIVTAPVLSYKSRQNSSKKSFLLEKQTCKLITVLSTCVNEDINFIYLG